MASGFVIRKNQYYDSVFLMGINGASLQGARGISRLPSSWAVTPIRRLLPGIGIDDPQIDAGAGQGPDRGRGGRYSADRQ